MADDGRRDPHLSRRAFLRGASAGLAAGGLTLAGGCKYGTQLFLISDVPKAESQRPAWAGSRVQRYRPLGRTGFQMSDISFGCSGLEDAAVARQGVERGITYFDTSPDYSRAGSEIALGNGIRGAPRARPGRDRIGRGEPPPSRYRLPRPLPHPRLQLPRPSDGPQHP